MGRSDDFGLIAPLPLFEDALQAFAEFSNICGFGPKLFAFLGLLGYEERKVRGTTSFPLGHIEREVKASNREGPGTAKGSLWEAPETRRWASLRSDLVDG